MAQLSESLVREAIRRIRAGHMHHLTANEIDQALWGWLMLNGHECCRRRPCIRPGAGPCTMPAQETSVTPIAKQMPAQCLRSASMKCSFNP